MAEPNGPWARKQPTPPRSPFRLYIWLGLIAAIIGSVWLLARAFPEQRLGGLAEGRLYYLITLLALVASGVVFGRQFKWHESLRNIAIWGGIAAVLVVGYLYQDVIADIGTRLRAEFIPGEQRSVRHRRRGERNAGEIPDRHRRKRHRAGARGCAPRRY